jgi:hypothetical protein
MNKRIYTAQLKSGLGVIEETETLLELWTPGMNASELFNLALNSGGFRNISATRLRDIITKCFFYRYLIDEDYPAWVLKRLKSVLSGEEFIQILFLFTARKHIILADFIKQVYWEHYASCQDEVSIEDARAFVLDAYRQGILPGKRSEYTLKRIASGLIGCCADYKLLDSGRQNPRKLLPFRIRETTSLFLAYDLHFSGMGDNAVTTHPDWGLFGLEKEDVLGELKTLSLKGHLLVQTAGEFSRIEWNYIDWEEFINAIAEKQL